MTDARSIADEFIAFAIESEVLRFGEFTLKSGRISPYFFNSGLFNTGERLARLAHYYAAAIGAGSPAFDMLYGPAYKGIPLVAAVSISLAREHGRDVPWCFNRKEAKDHGEGGVTVGAPLTGRVLIVDDVISAGTSTRESIGIIRAAGARHRRALRDPGDPRGSRPGGGQHRDPGATDRLPGAPAGQPGARGGAASCLSREIR